MKLKPREILFVCALCLAAALLIYGDFRLSRSYETAEEPR